MATSGSERPLTPAGGEHNPRAMPGHPIETFDHLLRDLLAYDLVERRSDTWYLRRPVAHRVSELVAASQSAGHVDVYVGYPCSRCHATRVTRAVGTSRLCDECLAATDDESVRDRHSYEPSARPPPPPKRPAADSRAPKRTANGSPAHQQPADEPSARRHPADEPSAYEPPAYEPPIGEPEPEPVVDVGTRRLVARHRLPPTAPRGSEGTTPER